ncbi:MAG: gas vesicle protein K [Candidatus Bathyarchaeota archaeon]|nr:gas vesicle protein K [Candidatus Bathyarchaeota archaeon]
MPIKIDEDNLKSGLLGLVVALVEIIVDVLEREAIRRMESGRLKDQEIDRLGNALMELHSALEHIKKENHLEKTIRSVRGDLSNLVEETIDIMANPERWEQEMKKTELRQ